MADNDSVGTYDRWGLLAPFDPDQVKTFIGRGKMELSYVDHGAVRRRLIECAGPVDMKLGAPYILNGAIVVEGTMTINGETHSEVGTEPVPDIPGMMADAIKMAVSDCWKRCAMSFGVGLHLWERDEDDHKAAMANNVWDVPAAQPVPVNRPSAQRSGPPQDGAWRNKPASTAQVTLMRNIASSLGWDDPDEEIKGVGIALGNTKPPSMWTAGDASDVINELKALQAAQRGPVR